MLRTTSNALKAAYANWSKDEGSLLAAGVAYYIALSLFPLLLVLVAGLGFFFSGTDAGQQAEQRLLEAASEQLSPMLSRQLASVFDQVREKASVGGPIGLATLLIAALAMFAQFDRAFDRIWNVEPHDKRGLWHSIVTVATTRLKALAMLLALGAVIVVVFVAGAVLATLERTAENFLPMTGQVYWLVEIGASVALNALTFSLIYRWIPKVDVRWRDALAGGLLAAIAWEIGRQVLARYVIGRKYESAYGLLGSFLAVMLWAYFAMSVLFFAAEFTQALRNRGAKNANPEPSTT